VPVFRGNIIFYKYISPTERRKNCRNSDKSSIFIEKHKPEKPVLLQEFNNKKKEIY